MLDDPQVQAAYQIGAVRRLGLRKTSTFPGMRYTSPDPPYTDEIVEDTYHWMVRWGLLDGTACSGELVDNRLAEPVAADD